MRDSLAVPHLLRIDELNSKAIGRVHEEMRTPFQFGKPCPAVSLAVLQRDHRQGALIRVQEEVQLVSAADGCKTAVRRILAGSRASTNGVGVETMEGRVVVGVLPGVLRLFCNTENSPVALLGQPFQLHSPGVAARRQWNVTRNEGRGVMGSRMMSSRIRDPRNGTEQAGRGLRQLPLDSYN